MTPDEEANRRVRVAAYAVVIRDGRLLLSRFVDGDRRVWTLPGGGLDHGEDPVDAVLREVTEETGYTAHVDRLLGVHSMTYSRRPPEEVHGVRIIYAARVVGGELRDEVDGSTDRAEWFPLDAVAGLERYSLVDQGLRLHRERPVTGRADDERG